MFSFARGKEFGTPTQVFSYKCEIEGSNRPPQLTGHAHSACDKPYLTCGHRKLSQCDKESSEIETFRVCVVLITGGEESEFHYSPSSQLLLIT